MGLIDQAFGQVVTDEEGRFTRVDRFVCDLLGYEPRALLGRHLQEVTHPEDRPAHGALLERLRAREEPSTVAKRCLRRDGSAVWVQSYMSLLRDADGRVSFSALVRPVLPGRLTEERASGPAPRAAMLLQAMAERRAGRELN